MTTPDPIEQVRGNVDDGLWSARAGFALAWAGVPQSRIDEELADVAEQMRDSGEGPRELHGTPGSFARERVRALAEDGVPLGFDGPDGAEPLDDDAWLDQVRRALVRRGDLLPGQIDGRLRELEAHANQAGSPLWQEFGSPMAFVALLPLDVHRPLLRPALLWSLLTVLWIWIALDGIEPWLGWPVVLLCLLLAARHWFTYLRDLRRYRAASADASTRPATRSTNGTTTTGETR